jgi:hypothetical protein
MMVAQQFNPVYLNKLLDRAASLEKAAEVAQKRGDALLARDLLDNAESHLTEGLIYERLARIDSVL